MISGTHSEKSKFCGNRNQNSESGGNSIPIHFESRLHVLYTINSTLPQEVDLASRSSRSRLDLVHGEGTLMASWSEGSRESGVKSRTGVEMEEGQ